MKLMVKALIYGVFDAAVANQNLTANVAWLNLGDAVAEYRINDLQKRS
jgi:hypothetical protein